MPDAAAVPSSRRRTCAGFVVPRAVLWAGGLVVLFLLLWLATVKSRAPLVVYCAHDSIYAEKILNEFARRTKIPVSIRFDSEATKSLGLMELLLREKDRPRCDVFWNNELLGMLELAEQGVLLPYKGSGYERIPAAFKDPDGRWTGLAARMRVWIVNTQRMEVVASALPPADLKRVAVAKPLYGTTRTHYTVLWRLWGADRLKAWHREWRAQGAREVDGNAAVKNLVGEGVCDLGLTDTDDYFEGRDAGKPVAVLPVRVDGERTICIPNTVAIIRGTRRIEEARRLVDFLLSAEGEEALARSGSRQIPLGPVDETKIPPEVQALRRWAADGISLGDLGAARRECLEWLKTEYLR
jgi:iron(III) transport system substrate-binding protein